MTEKISAQIEKKAEGPQLEKAKGRKRAKRMRVFLPEKEKS